MPLPTCDICSSPLSDPVPELFALPTVTSDCRPWSVGRSVQICSGCGVMKRVVSPWANFNSIYKDYQSYYEPAGRTAKILQFAADKMPRPKTILDVGCGQGLGLRALSNQYPDASVQGYEPHSSNPETLRVFPKEKYDLITLFHVFEHVEGIHEMLAYIKSSLTDRGHVLIQVPYAAMWPFDLVIADHVWHFSKKSLATLFNKSGFIIIHIGNDVIKKELTLLATPLDMWGGMVFWEKKNQSIDWLLHYKALLDCVKDRVAIYGTGPAAAWAGNILGDKVAYYLDDDRNRRKSEFNGKDVFDPAVCDCPIVAPFPDWQWAEIKKARMRHAG